MKQQRLDGIDQSTMAMHCVRSVSSKMTGKRGSTRPRWVFQKAGHERLQAFVEALSGKT